MKILVDPVFECDICHTRSHWNDRWIAAFYILTKGYNGIEYEFHVCSRKCDQMLSDIGPKQRLKLYYDLHKK